MTELIDAAHVVRATILLCALLFIALIVGIEIGSWDERRRYHFWAYRVIEEARMTRPERPVPDPVSNDELNETPYD